MYREAGSNCRILKQDPKQLQGFIIGSEDLGDFLGDVSLSQKICDLTPELVPF